MVEIGGKPILWHILKLYSHYGIQDFIICCGYKGYVIKEYFANYFLHSSDVTIDMSENSMAVHQRNAEPWKVTLVDTGDATLTGGRLARVRDYVDGETFSLTYGDGVSDVRLDELMRFHNQGGKLATVTAVQPPGRFGLLDLDDDCIVRGFQEKPEGDGGWINGGFFILEPGIFSYLDGDETIWEQTPLKQLAASGQLQAYKHHGFWQPMDTLRDRHLLEDLWHGGRAPWKVW
jgi:glucose-1-phosphate cytidylyltransferase